VPATPSRIGFITNQFRVVTAGPNASVAALYGSAARETTEPVESFFDDPADAQVMANERLSLLEAQRSLVPVSIDQIEPAADLSVSTSLPTVRIIDDEQNRNSPALIVGFTIDMNTERSALETWG
jgi:hypothetical protein